MTGRRGVRKQATSTWGPQTLGAGLGQVTLVSHVSGSECALIGLLENILAPLWVFARFGDVPSAWTVAGGALLLATLIGHEVAAREPVRVSQPGARGYRTVNNL